MAFGDVRRVARQNTLEGALPHIAQPPAAAPPPEMIADPTKGMPGMRPDAPPAAAPAAPPANGFDGSGYGTWSGYLQAANDWFNPQVKSAKSEGEAKSLLQGFLGSLAPELEKRGAKFGGSKNETITINGKTYDMARDIGGASAPQMLELGLGGGGGAAAPMAPQGPLDPGASVAAPGVDSNAALQQILSQLSAGNAQAPAPPPDPREIKQKARANVLQGGLA